MFHAAGEPQTRRASILSCAVLVAALALPFASAIAKPARPALVAIIIDDLGNNLDRGVEALNLPGPVACAILPDLHYSTPLAKRVHQAGKEVLLHLPLEPTVRKDLLGPGSLVDKMDLNSVESSLRQSLKTVPFAVAINNHMGSQYTQDDVAMERLMDSIHILRPDLFFVDSLTTPHSVVRQTAAEYGIPSLSRDVFLDNDRSPDAINKQLDLLFRIARLHGTAIAIGHPYPETLKVLRERLKPLHEGDVRLVPLSLILALKTDVSAP
jgi:polysaccharide deacetylase 2 family uncharacterized protein YibQ